MTRFTGMGESGITNSCLVALDRVLSGPSRQALATVLTKSTNRHLILLWEGMESHTDGVIIRSGFRSGPDGGEGVRGFSLALCMLYVNHVPIKRLQIGEQLFDQIDRGLLPEALQSQILNSSEICMIPNVGWVDRRHWQLATESRLWRVQGWRWANDLIPWNDDASIVDDFDWEVGEKLNQACTAVTPESLSEDCQQVGLMLRDAWIEFSRIARQDLGTVAQGIGKNNVKGVVQALGLQDDLAKSAEHAYNQTNSLQHDRGATVDSARTCFNKSAEAMAQIVESRFPTRKDPRLTDSIRPNF